MFRPGRGGARPRALLLLAALVASGSGCRTVGDALAGVLGPGGAGETIDAHVVYRLRPGCDALLARTISHGYTVLSPREILEGDVEDRAAFVGTGIEETGVFEGPVRTGEVVFRYVPPAASETWGAGPLDVSATVDAVELTLEQGHARMVALCGPPTDDEPTPESAAPAVPRLPRQ